MTDETDDDLIRKSRDLAMRERAAFRRLVRTSDELDRLTSELDAVTSRLGRFNLGARPSMMAGGLVDLALTDNLIPFARRKSRKRQP